MHLSPMLTRLPFLLTLAATLVLSSCTGSPTQDDDDASLPTPEPESLKTLAGYRAVDSVTVPFSPGNPLFVTTEDQLIDLGNGPVNIRQQGFAELAAVDTTHGYLQLGLLFIVENLGVEMWNETFPVTYTGDGLVLGDFPDQSAFVYELLGDTLTFDADPNSPAYSDAQPIQLIATTAPRLQEDLIGHWAVTSLTLQVDANTAVTVTQNCTEVEPGTSYATVDSGFDFFSTGSYWQTFALNFFSAPGCGGSPDGFVSNEGPGMLEVNGAQMSLIGLVWNEQGDQSGYGVDMEWSLQGDLLLGTVTDYRSDNPDAWTMTAIELSR